MSRHDPITYHGKAQTQMACRFRNKGSLAIVSACPFVSARAIIRIISTPPNDPYKLLTQYGITMRHHRRCRNICFQGASRRCICPPCRAVPFYAVPQCKPIYAFPSITLPFYPKTWLSADMTTLNSLSPDLAACDVRNEVLDFVYDFGTSLLLSIGM